MIELLKNLPELLGAMMAALSSLIALSLLIPGEQPEKALQKALDFIKKFSRK